MFIHLICDGIPSETEMGRELLDISTNTGFYTPQYMRQTTISQREKRGCHLFPCPVTPM